MDVDLGGQRVSLVDVDPAVLGAGGRIDVLAGLQRLRSWVDALEQVVLAAMAGPGDAPTAAPLGSAVSDKQYVREEIACALRISPLTVNARLHVARELVERLPSTLTLLRDGAIGMRAARLLAETLGPLPDAAAAAVEWRVLGRAPGQTFPNFRACVQRAVLALDPRTAEARHDAARAGRRVEYRVLEDGMGSLFAVLPAEDLQAVRAAIQDTAGAAPATDNSSDPGGRDGGRSADQRRADAFVALVTGLSPATVRTRHGRRPRVQVTVALSTLLGVDDEPGELDGHGPIPAALARGIAADATGTWRRLVTDPLGRLLDYGRSVYRPPQALVDHVTARDQCCRFPGCRRQATRCHLDHQQAWENGGPTNPDNLQTLCARHHTLKHQTAWTVTGNPADVLTWTAPTGHTYLDPPGQLPLDQTSSATPTGIIEAGTDLEAETGLDGGATGSVVIDKAA